MVYGDLDGDSLDEAAVTTLFGDGGTGQISSIVVYRIIDGQLRLAGRIEGGDWSNGGIYDAEITGGYLWVDTFGNESWVCYADRLVETQWGLTVDGMVAVNRFTPRSWIDLDMQPTSELTFRPNTSTAVLSSFGRMTASRFTFWALAGQQVQLVSTRGPEPLSVVVTDLISQEMIFVGSTPLDLLLPATGEYQVDIELVPVDPGFRDRTPLEFLISVPS